MNNVYIYGAGIQGEIFYNACQDENIDVVGFIDDYCSQKERSNLPIYRLDDITNKQVTILISVGLLSRKIKQQLIAKHFINTHDFTESIQAVPSIIKRLKIHSLWFSELKEDRVNIEQLSKVNELLVDKKSQQLLAQIIRFREDFSVTDYVTPDENTQYFPADIDVLKTIENLRFVDAGAFTGDTAKSVANAIESESKSIDYITCFEPDKKNLTHLESSLSQLQQNFPSSRFFVYPCGVWHQSEFLNFSDGNSASSKIGKNTENGTLIHGVAIDDCVFNCAPNFIKMDIEGAEQNALIGAMKTIESYHPVLAICLYHRPADLWEIPLWINQHFPFYDMHLRVYGDMLLETVLYCLPKE